MESKKKKRVSGHPKAFRETNLVKGGAIDLEWRRYTFGRGNQDAGLGYVELKIEHLSWPLYILLWSLKDECSHNLNGGYEHVEIV